MNVLQKDEIGIPSTLVAIFANVFQVIGLEFINVVFTLIISVLSMVYLVYKIKNEKAVFDKRKNEQKNK
jgi:predicted amino acid-binding ACT domain protein